MSLYSGIPFLSGQTLWLTLDFVGRKEINRVSYLTLVDLNGTDLETFNITQGKASKRTPTSLPSFLLQRNLDSR